MFEYVDVTNDPSAERRSGLADDVVAKAQAIGFTDVGWVAAIVTGGAAAGATTGASSPEERHTAATLISRVMCASDGMTLLALTRTKGKTTISLKTLFEDGHVVSTEERPPGIAGRLVSRAISVPQRHHYDLATFPTSDLTELVAMHESRLREALAQPREGKENENENENKTETPRALIPGDLQVYIAMRKRYREIANPRFDAQQTFATRFSWGVFFVVSALGIAGLAFFGVQGSSAAFAGLIAIMFAALCGASAFPVALVLLAPLFVRDAEAPPPRAARDLLALSDDVRVGRVPFESSDADDVDGDRDRGSSNSDGSTSGDESDAPSAASTAALRALPTDVLARLRRLDTVVSIGNSLLLPIAGFALMPVLGSVGPTAALGSVASIDAAILFIMQRSRVDLLRDRFIPKLVEAEGPNASMAPTWLRWISLAIGILALVAARRAIAKGIEPAERWLLAEWGFLTALFVFAAWRSIRRRHARFDSLS